MNQNPPGPDEGRLARLTDRFAPGSVARSIGVLVGGTAFAHGITALTMPLATRLFTPEDFGAAAAFSSLIGIVVVVSCLRFEVAIPLPDDDTEAVNLLALSALSVVGISVLSAILVAVTPASVLGLLGQPTLTPHLWLAPFALLIGGFYLALQAWFVRRKAFGPIARSRVVQSASAAAGQLGLGLAGVAPLGLLVGQMLNYGAGATTLGAGLLWRERRLLSKASWGGMRTAFRAHHRFPRYSVWEALANAAAIHLPILLIAALAPSAEAGYVALAVFVLQAPMALLGNAAGQVYLSDAPVANREGRLSDFTADMLRRLLRLSVAPITALMVLSPMLFGAVFGQAWERSGVLVAWMAPWFLFQFLSSPLSLALHVIGRQRVAMVLQMAGLVLRVGAVLVAAGLQPRWIVEAYAVSGFVFYAAYLAVIAWAVGLRSRDLAKLAREAFAVAAVAAVAGWAVAVAVQSLKV